MSKQAKFKVGDHVRVIDSDAPKFDQVGTVTYFDPSDAEFPYNVVFDIPNHRPAFRERQLTLADPDVHEVLAEMADECGLAAEEKTRKDMAEMEIDGEYVRGGSVDHAATLKTMAQG